MKIVNILILIRFLGLTVGLKNVMAGWCGPPGICYEAYIHERNLASVVQFVRTSAIMRVVMSSSPD